VLAWIEELVGFGLSGVESRRAHGSSALGPEKEPGTRLVPRSSSRLGKVLRVGPTYIHSNYSEGLASDRALAAPGLRGSGLVLC